MALGARLSELRLRRGSSLQEVGDAVGVSKTHIWALEKGKSENPSMELLKKLAEYYKVPIEYLAGADDGASLDTVEAEQFFRDFKSLSEQEKTVLKQTLELFKSRKPPGDAST